MNEAQSKRALRAEDWTDSPAPVGIEKVYSSDEDDLCDEEYEGALTSKDTHNSYFSDWISEIKRIEDGSDVMIIL